MVNISIGTKGIVLGELTLINQPVASIKMFFYCFGLQNFFEEI